MKNRNYFFNMLAELDISYLVKNNLLEVCKWLVWGEEESFIKACIRCSDRYDRVIFDEEVIYDFLTDMEDKIREGKSLYEEEYIYNMEELNRESYNEEYEETVIDLIKIYNDCNISDYKANEVFNCLRSYIEDSTVFVTYPFEREVVYLNEYSTEEEQEQFKYAEMTIENVINIAKQYLFRYKLI